MANTISISVLGDVKDINRKLGNVDKQLSGFGKRMKGLGTLIAGAFAGSAALSGIQNLVSGASDLNETVSKTEQVFGKKALPALQKYGEGAAEALGLSKQAALENLSSFGNLFTQIGMTSKQAEGLSKSFLQMSADLGSFNNVDTATVSEAFQSAMRGEYDSLQRYIPTINAARVEKEALAMTGKKSAKQLTDEEKALAINKIAMEGMGKAQGDFARTSDGLANKQKILSAKLQNVKDKIGGALLPIMTTIATFVSDTVIPAFEDFYPTLENIGRQVGDVIVPAFQNLVGWIQQNASWLAPLAVAVGAIAVAYGLWSGAIAIWSAITKAATAVQIALNVALSANPIGIIILAVIGLIAAIVYLWKTNEGFREVVTKVWNAIKAGVGAVVDWFKTAIPAAWNWVKAKTTSVWNAIKSFFSTVWNLIVTIATAQPRLIIAIVTGAWEKVKSATTAAWNAVKSGISKVWDGIISAAKTAVGKVNDVVRGIREKVVGIFSNAGSWLINAGKAILDGLVSGIRRGIDKVKEILQSVTGLIPDWKGPAEKDATLLFDAGTLIMQGLVDGINAEKRNLKKTLKAVTGIVQGTDVGMVSGGAIGVDMNSLRGSLSASSAGNTYYLTVQALDPQSAATATVEAIREYERLNGSGWRG